MSIGSVTGTDHPKGPCDSYSQGPFAISGQDGSPRQPIHAPSDRRVSDAAQLWGNRAFLWMTGGRSVAERASSGGTRRMLAKALAHRDRQGIELSHALRQRKAGQLGDEGPHGAEPACWGWAAEAG